MSDEDVIRRRLLIDGDGTGDDRRLNLLLKSFLKWSSSNDSPEESLITQEKMIAQINQCEYAFKKSRMVAKMSAAELKHYENLTQETNIEIENAKRVIKETKEEFKEAKTVRKNRVEYEALANIINEQPDRKQTDEKLAQLKKEMDALEEKSNQLDKKLQQRKQQFSVMMASMCQLQALLDESQADEGLDVFDDEDMDILDRKADVETMDVS